MRVLFPGTDLQLEAEICLDDDQHPRGRPCPEFDHPEISNQNDNVFSCYIALRPGDIPRIGGKFSGSMREGMVDLLIDGVFVQSSHVEPTPEGRLFRYLNKRNIKFHTRDSHSPHVLSLLEDAPPNIVIEQGTMKVKAFDDDEDYDLCEIPHERARNPGVGTIAVIFSLDLEPETTPQYIHHYRTAKFGSWPEGKARYVYDSGITPNLELEHVGRTRLDLETQQKQGKNFRSRFHGTRLGNKAIVKFVFHYRTAAALKKAKCEPRSGNFQEMKIQNLDTFYQAPNSPAIHGPALPTTTTSINPPLDMGTQPKSSASRDKKKKKTAHGVKNVVKIVEEACDSSSSQATNARLTAAPKLKGTLGGSLRLPPNHRIPKDIFRLNKSQSPSFQETIDDYNAKRDSEERNMDEDMAAGAESSVGVEQVAGAGDELLGGKDQEEHMEESTEENEAVDSGTNDPGRNGDESQEHIDEDHVVEDTQEGPLVDEEHIAEDTQAGAQDDRVGDIDEPHESQEIGGQDDDAREDDGAKEDGGAGVYGDADWDWGGLEDPFSTSHDPDMPTFEGGHDEAHEQSQPEADLDGALEAEPPYEDDIQSSSSNADGDEIQESGFDETPVPSPNDDTSIADLDRLPDIDTIRAAIPKSGADDPVLYQVFASCGPYADEDEAPRQFMLRVYSIAMKDPDTEIFYLKEDYDSRPRLKINEDTEAIGDEEQVKQSQMDTTETEIAGREAPEQVQQDATMEETITGNDAEIQHDTIEAPASDLTPEERKQLEAFNNHDSTESGVVASTEENTSLVEARPSGFHRLKPVRWDLRQSEVVASTEQSTPIAKTKKTSLREELLKQSPQISNNEIVDLTDDSLPAPTPFSKSATPASTIPTKREASSTSDYYESDAKAARLAMKKDIAEIRARAVAIREETARRKARRAEEERVREQKRLARLERERQQAEEMMRLAQAEADALEEAEKMKMEPESSDDEDGLGVVKMEMEE